jgi:hypothetical protein
MFSDEATPRGFVIMLRYAILIAGMQFGDVHSHADEGEAALSDFRRNHPELASISGLITIRLSD